VVDDLLDEPDLPAADHDADDGGGDADDGGGDADDDGGDAAADHDADDGGGDADDGGDSGGEDAASRPDPVSVFGDSAYADGATLDRLAEARHEVFAKVPPVRNAKGYSKDEFTIDTDAGTVDCPAGHTAPIRARRGGGGLASFTPWCALHRAN
jgi:hypothetical protein